MDDEDDEMMEISREDFLQSLKPAPAPQPLPLPPLVGSQSNAQRKRPLQAPAVVVATQVVPAAGLAAAVPPTPKRARSGDASTASTASFASSASSSADAGVPPPEANTWVQCDECRKWRRIDAEAAVAARAAPRWHCRMNADAAYAFCAAAQEEDAEDAPLCAPDGSSDGVYLVEKLLAARGTPPQIRRNSARNSVRNSLTLVAPPLPLQAPSASIASTWSSGRSTRRATTRGSPRPASTPTCAANMSSASAARPRRGNATRISAARFSRRCPRRRRAVAP